MTPTAPVTPAAQPATPAAPAPEQTGRQMLNALRKPIDYSEDDITEPAAPVEPAAPATPTPEPAAPAEPKKEEPKPTTPNTQEELLRQALIRQRIAEVEAERAKAERDLLMRQVQQPPVPQQQEPTREQLLEMYQNDPMAVIEMVSKKVAEETKQKTIAELQQQDQQQQSIAVYNSKVQAFQANIQKNIQENPELQDPNSDLYKELSAVEKEFPMLLTVPEGPIKGLELAKGRLELKKLKASVPQQTPNPAAQPVQATEPVPQPSMASMVSGPSRGVPPSPVTKLTKEEELAARRMRMTPEQFSTYRDRSSKQLLTEQAPKRRVA